MSRSESAISCGGCHRRDREHDSSSSSGEARSGADRFVVVTGGPGSGKTTLISSLAASGMHCMPEAGRAVIRDQVAIGGSALRWADQAAFADAMLSWEMRSYREAEALEGLVIFDRGVPDVFGYLRQCDLAVGAHVRRAAELYRYRPQVFLAPPWPEIFVRDDERKQSREQAEATYRALAEGYSDLGYELVELPRSPVEERARFVRARIEGARV